MWRYVFKIRGSAYRDDKMESRAHRTRCNRLLSRYLTHALSQLILKSDLGTYEFDSIENVVRVQVRILSFGMNLL